MVTRLLGVTLHGEQWHNSVNVYRGHVVLLHDYEFIVIKFKVN